MPRILLVVLFVSGSCLNIAGQQLLFETEIVSRTRQPENTQSEVSSVSESAERLRRSLLGELNSNATRFRFAVSTDDVRIEDVNMLRTTLVSKSGPARVFDETSKSYWTLSPKPATSSLEGLGARLSWRRAGTVERVGDVEVERVVFDIEMFPAAENSQKSIEDGNSFLISGELWIAPAYKRYASHAALLWPRVAILPTLAELSDRGLIVRSAIAIDLLGIDIETTTSSIVEQPLDSELFKVPSGFRQVSAPDATASTPQLISRVAPGYPAEAARHKIDGVVVLEVTIRTDGSVHNPKVIKSLGYGLDEAAIESVLKWRYRPAHRRGIPVESKLVIQFGFTYREQQSTPAQ